MVELLWSEIIREIFLQNQENNYLLILIILGGFLISTFLSIGTSFLGSQQVRDKKIVAIANLLTFVLNFILWVIICRICVVQKYPGILDNLSGIQKLVIFPKLMMIFSVYILPNLTLLWLIAGWTHAILYVIILKVADVQVDYKTKESKETFW
ncbi:hypothetical protein [Candidatus Lokiarchaeum ossiferum]|uniref:hypothetical protein n=1 Tax=Candidatus Lokiarchaeum ossiferum TaxID=2951803 RepID=UPI00352F3F29